MKFQNLWVNLDMFGCPNRCKHCWLGWGPNAGLGRQDLIYMAEAFRPFTEKLLVYDWYREPDFSPDYREMWQLCDELSTPGCVRDHFELASIWRLVRDESYPDWLKSLGVNVVQMTLFGGEATTDRFTGRKGAYQDILKSVGILLDHGIAPRIQAFVNRQNVDELPVIEALIRELDLEARCRDIGQEFACFVHQGSCDGRNADFYPDWVTPEDLDKIPPLLVEHTLRHFGKESLMAVFGRTEGDLMRELLEDNTTCSFGEREPVLYVDSHFDVYPNFTTPGPNWRLGNLKQDGAERVLEAYIKDESPAQHTRRTVPVKELARLGDPESRRLFGRGDYIELLLSRFLEGKV